MVSDHLNTQRQTHFVQSERYLRGWQLHHIEDASRRTVERSEDKVVLRSTFRQRRVQKYSISNLLGHLRFQLFTSSHKLCHFTWCSFSQPLHQCQPQSRESVIGATKKEFEHLPEHPYLRLSFTDDLSKRSALVVVHHCTPDIESLVHLRPVDIYHTAASVSQSLHHSLVSLHQGFVAAGHHEVAVADGLDVQNSEASDLNRGRVRPLVVLAFEIAV
mmetsp:Transcript_20830/g.41265  ORF Transcript_20830/g.41265 Transcript_20830/m.41265 type:complete len:217 (-) Transcript_20830:498-1148(-)